MALEGVLARLPIGYSAYLGAQDRVERQGQEEMRNVQGVLSMLAASQQMREQAQTAPLRRAMTEAQLGALRQQQEEAAATRGVLSGALDAFNRNMAGESSGDDMAPTAVPRMSRVDAEKQLYTDLMRSPALFNTASARLGQLETARALNPGTNSVMGREHLVNAYLTALQNGDTQRAALLKAQLDSMALTAHMRNTGFNAENLGLTTPQTLQLTLPGVRPQLTRDAYGLPAYITPPGAPSAAPALAPQSAPPQASAPIPSGEGGATLIPPATDQEAQAMAIMRDASRPVAERDQAAQALVALRAQRQTQSPQQFPTATIPGPQAAAAPPAQAPAPAGGAVQPGPNATRPFGTTSILKGSIDGRNVQIIKDRIGNQFVQNTDGTYTNVFGRVGPEITATDEQRTRERAAEEQALDTSVGLIQELRGLITRNPYSTTGMTAPLVRGVDWLAGSISPSETAAPSLRSNQIRQRLIANENLKALSNQERQIIERAVAGLEQGTALAGLADAEQKLLARRKALAIPTGRASPGGGRVNIDFSTAPIDDLINAARNLPAR